MQVALNVDGKTLDVQLIISWNQIAGYWVMRIIDPATATVLLDSIPLLCADPPTSNLLGQYAYLGLGSAYIFNVGGAGDSPDDTNLGTDYQLLWGDSA